MLGSSLTDTAMVTIEYKGQHTPHMIDVWVDIGLAGAGEPGDPPVDECSC